MICKKCGSEFIPTKGLISYCSISCRNSRKWSDDDKEKMFSVKTIQYLVTYNISGTSIGTGYVACIDFPKDQIGRTAQETTINIMTMIWSHHNENFTPKLEEVKGIGIVSLTKIN